MSHTGGRVTALPLQALRKSSRLLIELCVTNVFANELMKEVAVGGTPPAQHIRSIPLAQMNIADYNRVEGH